MNLVLFGNIINENDTVVSKHETIPYLSATDLVRVGNIWRERKEKPRFRIDKWKARSEVKEHIQRLEEEVGTVVIYSSVGKGSTTWVHPMLFAHLFTAVLDGTDLTKHNFILDMLRKTRFKTDFVDLLKHRIRTFYKEKDVDELIEEVMDEVNFYSDISAKEDKDVAINREAICQRLADALLLLPSVPVEALRIAVKQVSEDFRMPERSYRSITPRAEHLEDLIDENGKPKVPIKLEPKKRKFKLSNRVL